MKTTHPGMHPRLEARNHFPGFRNGLMTSIHYCSAPRLPEHYQARVETSRRADYVGVYPGGGAGGDGVRGGVTFRNLPFQ